MKALRILSNICGFYVSLYLIGMVLYRGYQLIINLNFSITKPITFLLIILSSLLLILYCIYQILRSMNVNRYISIVLNRFSRVLSAFLIMLTIFAFNWTSNNFYNTINTIFIIISILTFEFYWLIKNKQST